MTNTTMDDYSALAQAALDWDGTIGVAEVLRARLVALPEPRRKPESDAEHVLFRLRNSSVAGKYDPRIREILTTSVRARVVAPFLGLPQIPDWPFFNPCSMPDEDAPVWLGIVGKYGYVDERVRRFIRIMFRDRKRQVWIPAAEALALASSRDPELCAWLKSKWQTCFPAGFPVSWSGFQAPSGVDIHEVRHIMYAVTAWVALGGEGTSLTPSFNGSKLTQTPLPKDSVSASIVLLACVPLLRTPSMDTLVLPQLQARLQEALETVPSHPSLEKALRSVADVLFTRTDSSECIAHGRAIEEILISPRWMGLPVFSYSHGDSEQERRFYSAERERFDACWSWVETARWLIRRGNVDKLQHMSVLCPPADLVLRLAASSEKLPAELDLVPSLITHLQVLYDDTLFLTTQPLARTVALVETVLLCQRPEANGIYWPKLMTRALGTRDIHVVARSSDATAGFVWDLTLFKQDTSSLVHDHELPEDVVVHLAAMQSGSVAIQVAIQAERILRSAARRPNCAVEQIKFLWRLLQRNPSTKFFDELLKVLRGDEHESGPLHDLIRSMREMDVLRAAGKSTEANPTVLMQLFIGVSARMHRLLAAMPETEMMGAQSASMKDALTALEKDLLEVVELLHRTDSETCSPAWLSTVGRRMERSGGLGVWLDWRGEPWPDLEQVWRAFAAASGAVYREKGVPCELLIFELGNSMTSLRERLDKLAWPESAVLLAALDNVELWAEAKRGDVRDRAKVVRLLERAYSSGEEAGAVEVADDQKSLACLNSREISDLTRFLLDRLLCAHVLRVGRFARHKGMAILPVLSYFKGMVFGIIAGVFAIPDFGTVWNELALRDGAWTLAMVALGCAVFAYAILLLEFAPTIGAHFGLRARWRAVFKRVTLLFVGGALLACGLSAIVLLSLQGTSACPAGELNLLQFFQQLALWTGLTLFLGLFVTVIIQGRKLRD